MHSAIAGAIDPDSILKLRSQAADLANQHVDEVQIRIRPQEMEFNDDGVLVTAEVVVEIIPVVKLPIPEGMQLTSSISSFLDRNNIHNYSGSFQADYRYGTFESYTTGV